MRKLYHGYLHAQERRCLFIAEAFYDIGMIQYLEGLDLRFKSFHNSERLSCVIPVSGGGCLENLNLFDSYHLSSPRVQS